MDERSQEFRIGMMAVTALSIAIFMVFRFGEIGNSWRSGTRIGVVMSDASGLFPQSPVQMSGIRIGSVESTTLVAEGRGVLVSVLIDSDYTFKDDSSAEVSTSLLGDAVLRIVPGKDGQPIQEGDRIPGRTASDPMAAVARVERQVTDTLGSFEATGREWARLAANINGLLEASGSDGVSTMQRSAMALQQFTETMQTAERTLAAAGTLISDPNYQKQLQMTLTALPQLLSETRTTLRTVNSVVREMDQTMTKLNEATTPLAANSETIVSRLTASLGNIEAMTRELAVVSQMMNQKDGTMKRLLTDPTVYRNLNATSNSLAVLLENLKPVVADLQVFSDKVARHPELLGVRGMVRGSDGSKDADVRPASLSEVRE